MREYLTVPAPIGNLVAAAEDGAVVGLYLPGDRPDKSFSESRTALLERTAAELQEYFCGKRKTFDLPLNPCGTVFQRKVWRELCRIPYGQAVSYGEIAARIGLPKAARAVGQANHRNPIPIIIPCHRVVAAGNLPGGYGGGIGLKIKLLELEGVPGFLPDAGR